jgi:hypothetical protein
VVVTVKFVVLESLQNKSLVHPVIQTRISRGERGALSVCYTKVRTDSMMVVEGGISGGCDDDGDDVSSTVT